MKRTKTIFSALIIGEIFEYKSLLFTKYNENHGITHQYGLFYFLPEEPVIIHEEQDPDTIDFKIWIGKFFSALPYILMVGYLLVTFVRELLK